jgi:hypothetical protein
VRGRKTRRRSEPHRYRLPPDSNSSVLAKQPPLEVGGATIEASAGDYAFRPRDTPNRYTVGENGCKMLFICTPAGFENLVIEMSEPADARTLPPAADGPPDMERVAAVAQANGCEPAHVTAR